MKIGFTEWCKTVDLTGLGLNDAFNLYLEFRGMR